jgi:hypothetical protein
LFQWGSVKGDIELQANLKVEKKVKEWNDRLVTICRNYIMVYPGYQGKLGDILGTHHVFVDVCCATTCQRAPRRLHTQDVGQMKTDVVPKQFLRLDKCSLQQVTVREELSAASGRRRRWCSSASACRATTIRSRT